MQFTKHPPQRMCRNCIVFFSFCELLTPLFKEYQYCSGSIVQFQKGIPWKWGPGKAFAFEQSKKLLISTNVLFHYNAELKLIMTEYHLQLVWVQSYHI